MKSFFIPIACIGGLFFTTIVDAQTSGHHIKQDQSGTVDKNSDNLINPTPIVTQRKNLNDVEISRKTLGSNELSRLPVRDINSIANTVAGVQSYGGGTPNIKGAPASGTAYFVDGVRVHGALPNAIR